MKQLRNFIFTCNNYTDDSIDRVKGLPVDLGCSYYIYGKEIGDKGTPHLQGYVELKNRISFKKVTEKLKGFHIEQRLGSQVSAIDYCKKDGDYTEYGDPKSPGTRNDLNKIKDSIIAGNSIKSIIQDDNININMQSLRFAEKLKEYYDKPRYFKPEVIWFYGKSGTGKTRRAVDALPQAYFKTNGSAKWWPGYDGEADIIIDDVESFNYPLKQLLGILDRYPYVVEFKGGTRQLQGKRIIVTSLDKPTLEYGGSPHVQCQLSRRIDCLIEVIKSGEGYIITPDL